MKQYQSSIFLAGLLALPLVACTGTSGTDLGQEGGAEGGSDPVATDPVNDTEPSSLEEDLAHLREEEKVARDVYLVLHDEWGAQIFENISQAEQQHMDTVKLLIDELGIPDPIQDDTVGVFENEELGALFESLVAQGLESVEAAYTVGVTIEDLDIFDIRVMSERTDLVRVLDVYASLECGSQNHMRAFAGRLDSVGASYAPQFITLDDYEAILSEPQGSCSN